MKKNGDKNANNIAEFTAKKGESLVSLTVAAGFSRKGNPLRKVEIVFISKREGNLPISTALVRLLIESGHLSTTALRSLLSKGRAGRRKIEVDGTTGKIRGTMKPESKDIIEAYNAGLEPDQILSKMRSQLKTPAAKSRYVSKIKRVLSRNRHLLTRTYGVSGKNSKDVN